MEEGIRVFVYGSLKSTKGNHYLLTTSKREPNTKIKGFKMFSVPSGAFPYILYGDGEIVVESYIVDIDILTILDLIEGHPSHYKRELVTSIDGKKGFIYVGEYYKNFDNDKEVESGEW